MTVWWNVYILAAYLIMFNIYLQTEELTELESSVNSKQSFAKMICVLQGIKYLKHTKYDL
jgi:hypothetical protein